MIIFETARLVVREFNSSDVDNFFSLQGNAEVMRYIRPPRTREESDEFLLKKVMIEIPQGFKGYWGVEEKSTGKFIGSFVIIPIPGDEEKIQLGYSFLPEYWGRGYGTEVSMGGVNYFLTRTPLEELYAVTESENVASQKVLLKSGFHPHASSSDGDKELLIFIIRRNPVQ